MTNGFRLTSDPDALLRAEAPDPLAPDAAADAPDAPDAPAPDAPATPAAVPLIPESPVIEGLLVV